MEKVNVPQEGSQCLHCLNYKKEYGDKCPAFFPKPIPQDILSGKSNHEEPVEGQEMPDIVFEPDNDYLYKSL